MHILLYLVILVVVALVALFVWHHFKVKANTTPVRTPAPNPVPTPDVPVSTSDTFGTNFGGTNRTNTKEPVLNLDPPV
jgi:flagellar basal body-associated protein FliL